MKHLSQKEVQELRGMLEEEQKNLERQLSEHGRNVAGNWQGIPRGFGENEADEIDEADKMEELVTNVSLVETLETRLKEVTNALAKMEGNTYGIDEETGRPIALERLRANPAARTNI